MKFTTKLNATTVATLDTVENILKTINGSSTFLSRGMEEVLREQEQDHKEECVKREARSKAFELNKDILISQYTEMYTNSILEELNNSRKELGLPMLTKLGGK